MPAFEKEYPNGIDGHQVKVDFENDGGDPTTGAAVANKFVDEHVTAVMHVSDLPEVGDIQMGILSKAGIPTITYDTSTALENTTNFPYNFGVSVSVSQQAASGLQWIMNHPEFKRIAVLTDNTPALVSEYQAGILDPLTKADPGVKVVATASVNSTTLDFSTAIAQLKASKPDLVMVFTSGSFGNIWKAISQASWAPQILTTSNAFYNGYDALGSLGPDVHILTSGCVPTTTPSFPAATNALMAAYAKATFGASPDMLVYVQTDSVGLELLRDAIDTSNSSSPAAIKSALEHFKGDLFWPGDTYAFSPTNHYGISGVYGSQVCDATPLVDGPFQLPVISK